MTELNLFRGQAIGIKVDEIGDDLVLEVDVEDYNALPPIIDVGAPTGDMLLTQADGTKIAVDGRAGLTGATQAFKTYADGGYWPNDSPTLDLVTGFLAPEVPGLPVIDQTTAMTNLKAFVDSQAPRVSGALRWWLAPPPSGDGLILYWVDYNDPDQVALLPAPYQIWNNADPDWSAGKILPIKLGPIGWDWKPLRGSVYVRGGTPAPEGSGWATGLGSAPTGDAYVDAPGSITDDDKTAIGLWHQNREFVELMTGSATMPGFKDDVNYLGWAVGQTVLITSARHSRFTDHALAARASVIQKVVGRLVGPGSALSLLIDGTILDRPYDWVDLSFESVMAGAGKMVLKIHLLDDGAPLVVNKKADIWLTVDDTQPADLEWDLEVGDIPKGSLTRELAKVVTPFVPPVYRFNITEADPDGVKRGFAEQVSAQVSDGPSSPIPLPGLPMEWILIQWEDEAETVPGDLLSLADETGTTDSAGRVFTTLGPGGVGIDSFSVDDPTEVTTSSAHGLTTGDTVVIRGVTGSTPPIDGTYVVTVTGADTYTIPVDVTVAGTGGLTGKSDPLPAGYNWQIVAVALPVA